LAQALLVVRHRVLQLPIMKIMAILAIVGFFAGICHASSMRDAELPIQQVVKLIADLKARVVSDGKAEQVSYDKYACWCENTLERKSADISSAKDLIAETETLIKN